MTIYEKPMTKVLKTDDSSQFRMIFNILHHKNIFYDGLAKWYQIMQYSKGFIWLYYSTDGSLCRIGQPNIYSKLLSWVQFIHYLLLNLHIK